ncbi:MAG TPA: GNAT family N-acetyltransferase [Ferrovibrio sp.]|jgi:putative acetyltransferase|uniref:GNAT family N-acetyltransferase n=1 Tax=Ferrovibrio sp. TaxID=1917215 RepID=UPI002B4AE8BF|nr:GNAT family N-acetyltransferase [Ferrovibrio sp.]HLT78281.1 GNAT family N-acetyltransferase [Ferrovibrio sp.]
MQTTPTITIAPAESADDLAAAGRLFLAYAQSLDFSLCFQGFDAELAGLPGKYAPEQGGALLLARVDGEPKGVVALRALEPGICEMKRLYVDPAARGLKLGRRLAEAIMAEGRRLGYRVMRLDTLHRMPEANRLYDRLGFRDIPPYIHNPLPDVRYREADL